LKTFSPTKKEGFSKLRGLFRFGYFLERPTRPIGAFAILVSFFSVVFFLLAVNSDGLRKVANQTPQVSKAKLKLGTVFTHAIALRNNAIQASPERMENPPTGCILTIVEDTTEPFSGTVACRTTSSVQLGLATEVESIFPFLEVETAEESFLTARISVPIAIFGGNSVYSAGTQKCFRISALPDFPAEELELALGIDGQRLGDLKKAIMFGSPKSRKSVCVGESDLPGITLRTRVLEGKFNFDLESWLQCFYYSFVSATTVGYGDFVPTLPETQILSVVEALAGIVLTGLFVSSLTSWNKNSSSLESQLAGLIRNSKEWGITVSSVYIAKSTRKKLKEKDSEASDS
jgi:hypothetical protein